jgi:suppressor of G2 allele of SKP1
MAAFSLENFALALEAFNKGNELKPSAQFKTWIRKCEAELSEARPQPVAAIATPTPAPASTTTTPNVVAPPAGKYKYVMRLHLGLTVRHDFFQTSTHVTVSIFAKGVKKDLVQVTIRKKQVHDGSKDST